MDAMNVIAAVPGQAAEVVASLALVRRPEAADEAWA